VKRNAELFFPAEFADDFPVSLQISERFGLVYVVTKLGLLFVYDLETATAVYRNRISPDPIFLAAPSDSTGGIFAINRWAAAGWGRPEGCGGRAAWHDGQGPGRAGAGRQCKVRCGRMQQRQQPAWTGLCAGRNWAMYDRESATLVGGWRGAKRQPRPLPLPLLCAAPHRRGQVLLSTVNEAAMVPFVSQQLNNLDLALSMARRGNLPGAEGLVAQQFERLFAAGQYKEAAEVAAESPQGILRTKEVRRGRRRRGRQRLVVCICAQQIRAACCSRGSCQHIRPLAGCSRGRPRQQAGPIRQAAPTHARPQPGPPTAVLD
jgi:hypothetical protein